MADTDLKLKRHPIRGGLFGLLLGFSAAYFAFFRFSLVGFDSIPGVATKFGLIVLGGVALGIVWAYLAPAKKPKSGGATPASPAPPPAES